MPPRKKPAAEGDSIVVIRPAHIVRTTLHIKGTAPLVQNKFSQKAREMMMDTMSRTKANKKTKSEREPRDFVEDFLAAQHRMSDGSYGVPCTAFRAAMIDACRAAGLEMTRTKLALFVVPDGFDVDDGTPLVRLIANDPERIESAVRNASGVADIRSRPIWREWEINITIDFDADMITPDSVVNLLDRAGRQVGIGEGRPFSKKSVGQGWGTFIVETLVQETVE